MHLDEHERFEHLSLQRRGPQDALDLRRRELGELHAPLHAAAGLPLELAAVPPEGRGSVAAVPAGVRIVGVPGGVGGPGGPRGAERARVAAEAGRGRREGGQEAGRRLEGDEEERAAQRDCGGGGGVRHCRLLQDWFTGGGAVVVRHTSDVCVEGCVRLGRWAEEEGQVLAVAGAEGGGGAQLRRGRAATHGGGRRKGR